MNPPGGARSAPGQRALLRALLTAALAVLGLLLAARLAGAVAAPLVFIGLAVILAMGLNPLVVRLEARLRLPRALAAGLVVLLVVAVLAALVWLAVPRLASQALSFSREFPQMVGTLQTNLLGWARRYPAIAPLLEGRSFADPTALLKGSGANVVSLLALAASLANAAFSGFLLVMLVLYLLMSPEPMVKGLMSGVPVARRPVVERTLARIGSQLGAWLVGRLLISLGMGALAGVGLALAGFEDALLFGVVVGVADLIPVVGPLIGMVPPALAALAVGSPSQALWAVGIIFALQQLEVYLVSPYVFGRSVRLHPASLIIGVLVFGALLGLVGIFLTVPLLIIAKALYEEVYLASLHAPAVSDTAAAKLVKAGAEPVAVEDAPAQPAPARGQAAG